MDRKSGARLSQGRDDAPEATALVSLLIGGSATGSTDDASHDRKRDVEKIPRNVVSEVADFALRFRRRGRGLVRARTMDWASVPDDP